MAFLLRNCMAEDMSGAEKYAASYLQEMKAQAYELPRSTEPKVFT